MQPIKSVSIIGAGAMGAFYASKFYEMERDGVCLIAGGDRYKRLSENGLVVNGQPYQVKVVKPEDETGPSDLIIVAVKHHQLEQAIKDIERQVGDGTSIISVMNGIESEEAIASAYGEEKVLYAVAVGIDAVRENGKVTYTKQGKLMFGEAQNAEVSERVKTLKSLFDRAGIVNETPEDMIRVLWWKYMINVGINQVSAVLDAPYGVFQKFEEARELMESAMREVIAVANAADIKLTEEDIQNWNEVLKGMSPEGKTSMVQDVEVGRKTELDMFAGKVIRLGERYGIPTPVNQTLYRFIRVIEQRKE